MKNIRRIRKDPAYVFFVYSPIPGMEIVDYSSLLCDNKLVICGEFMTVCRGRESAGTDRRRKRQEQEEKTDESKPNKDKTKETV
ncbi:MAG: hypothetical protein IJI20_02020 [Firmicutes bacterium]|nr:hypothetical protein [Bacillota bacterium]